MNTKKLLLTGLALLTALTTATACSVNNPSTTSAAGASVPAAAASASAPAAAGSSAPLASSAAGSGAAAPSSAMASGSSGASSANSIDLGPYCDTTCGAALKLTASPSSVSCKVAFLDDATSFPYGAAQLALSQTYAKKYFPNMQLTVLNGNNDPATQSSQLDTVVSQGFKTVVLDPVVADALVPATKRAVTAGVKVVAIDRTVNTPVLSTIKAPDVPLAVRAAQYIAETLHGKGNVAILSGTPGASPTIDRTAGFNQVISKYPRHQGRSERQRQLRHQRRVHRDLESADPLPEGADRLDLLGG